MQIVTWNVNSVRARAERVQRFLREKKPDVLCLQETKAHDEVFPRALFESEEYTVAIHGQKTYNGVAIVARAGLEIQDVVRGLPGEQAESDRRAISATVGGVRIINFYVVNGQEVGSPKYAYKLEWLARARAHVASEIAKHPATVVVGDFNIAPDDRDVFDPVGLKGMVLLSDAERAELKLLMDLGLTDGFRHFNQEPGIYTWWDYRMLGFPKNRGYRLDLVLLTNAALGRLQSVTIDRDERKGEGASDHAPVVATLL